MTNFEQHFPINARPRPLRFPDMPLDVPHLMHDMLAVVHRSHAQQFSTVLIAAARARHELARLQAAAADNAGGQTLADALQIVADNLQDVLDDHDVQVIDLTGQRWTIDQVAEVEVIGHQLREDLAHPRVARMPLPIVRQRGQLLAKGSVLVEAPPRDS